MCPRLLIHNVQMSFALFTDLLLEIGVRRQLEQLASHAACKVWGFDPARLHCRLSLSPRVSGVERMQSESLILQPGNAAGWSTVSKGSDSQLIVEACGWSFTLLIHEAIKGIAELICLHGLNELSDEDYASVIESADRMKYEVPMLQAGPWLWRLLVDVMEPHHSPADYLLHIAKLDPETLESLMFAVVDDPSKARRILGDIMDVYVEPEPWIASDA